MYFYFEIPPVKVLFWKQCPNSRGAYARFSCFGSNGQVFGDLMLVRIHSTQQQVPQDPPVEVPPGSSVQVYRGC